MSFKDKLDQYKQRKDLIDELDFYKSIISRRIEHKNFRYALEKIESAIILIKENQQFYNLDIELSEFENLKEEIISELEMCQKFYTRRYSNLLKETLTESNIENFLRLLAMLKGEVDENLDNFNLKDLSARINRYFTFLKRLYTIISSYKVLNYHGASNKILEFVKEIKSEDYPNIKALIFYIYQDLLNNQFSNFSKQYDRLSITELSEKLAINQDSLSNFLGVIMKDPNCPIKKYNAYTQEVIFSR